MALSPKSKNFTFNRWVKKLRPWDVTVPEVITRRFNILEFILDTEPWVYHGDYYSSDYGDPVNPVFHTYPEGPTIGFWDKTHPNRPRTV